MKTMKTEFTQARHHFIDQKKSQKSIKNWIKQLFIHGRQVVDKSLYKKYKDLSINNGVQNLQGSLHIVKFSDNQDYGMIILKQREFKQLDNLQMRIEQVHNLINQVLHCCSLSNSSSPVPNSIDKSDQIVMNPYITKTNIGIGELNGDAGGLNSNQNTKHFLDSPATMVSHSHLDNQAFNYQQNQRKITINQPFTQSNYNFRLSQNLQNTSHNGTQDNQLKSLNRIPLNQTILPNQNYQFNLISFNKEANQFFSTQQTPSNNTFNQKHPQVFVGQSQEKELWVSNSLIINYNLNILLLKAKLCLHILQNDLKEYSLTCREQSFPEYKKYRRKWFEKESKNRDDYEKSLHFHLQNDSNFLQKYQIFQQQIQYIQQQAQFFDPNQNNFTQLQYLDNGFIDLLIGKDIQSYSLNTKKQGIYTSVISRIEDLYQSRTVIINLKAVLENYLKIICFGEKICVSFEYSMNFDPYLLSEDEKIKLREAYGENIIEENYERGNLIGTNTKTQVTGIFPLQNQGGISTQWPSPLLSKTDRQQITVQEEDLETFREMILSITQQIYNLYKDNSNSINMKVNRIYSKDGIYNPLLNFRKRYYNESLKISLAKQMNQPQKQNIIQQNNQNIAPQNQQTMGNQNLNKNGSNLYTGQKTLQALQGLPGIQRNSIQISNIDKRGGGGIWSEGQQPFSISNIPNVQSSKVSPNKQQRNSAIPQSFENTDKFFQYQIQQHNQNQEINSRNNLNNQAANLSDDINENQSNNFNFQNYNGFNHPPSATKKNQILTHMPEQISQTMSNSNNLGQTFDKPHGYPQKQIHMIQGDRALSELNQQSLTQSQFQQQAQELKNMAQYNSEDSSQLKNVGNDNLMLNTECIDEIIENGRYKKLRVARIHIEVTQSLINDNQTREYIQKTDYLSQIEEYAQYLSPLPMIYNRQKIEQSIVHSYTIYIENFVYQNNLTENSKSFTYEKTDPKEQIEKISSCQDCQSQSRDKKQIAEDNEDIEIVSLDFKNKDKKYFSQPQKQTLQNLGRISEQNAKDEDNKGSDVMSSEIKNPFFSQKKIQAAVEINRNKKSHTEQRGQINQDLTNTPKYNYQNSYTNVGSFQKSQDHLEQNSDRKFIKNQNPLPIRDQQMSFNAGGNQSFNNNQNNPETTFYELIQNDKSERKGISYINLNHANTMNDTSNIGFTDRQNMEEPPSIERKKSENLAKIARPEETTARPILTMNSKSGTNISQKELEVGSNRTFTSINDEIKQPKTDKIHLREREFSKEILINQVKNSDEMFKNNMFQKNIQNRINQLQNQDTINKAVSPNNSKTGGQSDNQSECSDFEYKKDLIDERDDKELTIILERSEAHNNSAYNNAHYKNQIHRQSSRIQDQYGSLINYRSQLQSQLITEELQKQYHSRLNHQSSNIILQSQGTKDLNFSYIDGKSLLHQNIINSNYHQTNSFLSGQGNIINHQNFEIKIANNKQEQVNKDIIDSQNIN